MAYKDKDRQGEYQRLWVRQKRRQKLRSVEPASTGYVEPSVPTSTTPTFASVEPWAGELTKAKQVGRG